jgi:hypothetical protein
MATWYKLNTYMPYKANSHIEPVEVERETDSCVYVAGRRRNKKGDPAYFPTWAEAKAEHISRCIRKHQQAQDAFDRACRELAAAELEAEPPK